MKWITIMNMLFVKNDISQKSQQRNAQWTVTVMEAEGGIYIILKN